MQKVSLESIQTAELYRHMRSGSSSTEMKGDDISDAGCGTRARHLQSPGCDMEANWISKDLSHLRGVIHLCRGQSQSKKTTDFHVQHLQDSDHPETVWWKYQPAAAAQEEALRIEGFARKSEVKKWVCNQNVESFVIVFLRVESGEIEVFFPVKTWPLWEERLPFPRNAWSQLFSACAHCLNAEQFSLGKRKSWLISNWLSPGMYAAASWVAPLRPANSHFNQKLWWHTFWERNKKKMKWGSVRAKPFPLWARGTLRQWLHISTWAIDRIAIDFYILCCLLKWQMCLFPLHLISCCFSPLNVKHHLSRAVCGKSVFCWLLTLAQLKWLSFTQMPSAEVACEEASCHR